MENRKFTLACIFSLTGTVIASFYPLYMGFRVLRDMITDGTVLKENYPKYIIPYTPISFALIIGVLLMPLLMKFMKRYAVAAGSSVSLMIFFVSELLFEKKIIVTTSGNGALLGDWQMYLCRAVTEVEIAEAQKVRTETAVDILIGNYNPAFKLHFYLISVVLILAILNCIYGFAQMIRTGDNSRKRALILQSVSAATFLGLCILACFTAFWRDNYIKVPPVSAVLMTIFFILLGVTIGLFLGSMLLGRSSKTAMMIPSLASSATTLLMYVGEMILLHGHLYIFGEGFLFADLPLIVLSPFDILVIIASGAVTFFLMKLVLAPHKKQA